MQDVSSRFRYLSRRGFLIAGGMAVTAIGALPATPVCTLTNEQEEGPYYIDDETLRRDITEGRPGVPLSLSIKLVDAKTCAPLQNAALDIWHCDSLGVYSGFTANSPNGGPGGPRSREVDATRFLRGVQITDDRGVVAFTTLYPGWYFGRAIHIHMKVHVGGAAEKSYSGGHVAHTGQLFFPEDITGRIARVEPYAQRLKVHRTTQAEDGIFNSQHGAECMVTMDRLGKTDEDGFRASATLAINAEATPRPVGGFGGPRRRG